MRDGRGHHLGLALTGSSFGDRLADGQALSGLVTKQHARHVLRAARLPEGMETVPS